MKLGESGEAFFVEEVKDENEVRYAYNSRKIILISIMLSQM